ncbi:MAG TPA: biotin/lipoyl-binding protein [Pyrinomonadaceae bacterium]|nr:biotin/lipoyl-binding protein [Pyrinomonadaceae bacterium]
MKLQAQLGELLHDIELKRDGEKVFAKVDDREYELEASEPEPNVYLLKHAGNIYEFYVAPAVQSGSPQIVSSRNSDVEVALVDPKRLRGSAGAGGIADGLAEIKTMMPGKVVRLIANVGNAVEKGDAVLVVEAMKMQNDLKAPKAGIVKDIKVSEGSTVSAGDVLAIIE